VLIDYTRAHYTFPLPTSGTSPPCKPLVNPRERSLTTRSRRAWRRIARP